MSDLQLKRSGINQVIPWLILVYGTARIVALLSPPPKATGEPIAILGSALPDPATIAAVWTFALALFLFAL